MRKDKATLMAALVLAFVIAGCSCSVQPSNVASSSASSDSTSSSVSTSGSTSEPTDSASSFSDNSPVDDDGQNPVMNFIGKYGAGRATILVEATGKSDANITVEWASNAAEGSTWRMSGTLDTDTLTVNYTDCVKVDYAYEGEGGRNETVVYTDGRGSVTFDGGSGLTWDDEQEHIADGVRFTWAP